MVHEMESVNISCFYNGTNIAPSWLINGTSYTLSNLPPGHSPIFQNNKHLIHIKNATLNLNSTTYQCIVVCSGKVFQSREGILIIGQYSV